MRLIKVAALFEVGHDAADGGGAEGLFVAFRDGTRGYRLARFDVRADDVSQDLAIAAVLKSRVAHKGC
jgi:hypothetical protein